MSWKIGYLRQLTANILGGKKTEEQPDLPFDPPLPKKSPSKFDPWPKPKED